MSHEALFENGVAPGFLELIQSPKDLKEASYYRFELPRTYRWVEPLVGYPQDHPPISADGLKHWLASPQFREEHAAFAEYPQHSLLSACGRSLLYHLIRVMQPKHVVEIGTYFAAATEVMARALWENGSGVLHTADPFGRIRCPSLMARWEPDLRRYVNFYPWNSMQLFQHLTDRQVSLDIAFIDGNHDFEFALFDLQAAARLLRPGGIAVMDDTNQTGPFWATKVFLEQNPGWLELTGGVAEADAGAPLNAHPQTFPGTPCLVLQAPVNIAVGRFPFTTGQIPFRGRQLDALEFTFEPGQTGTLHGRLFLRAFPSGGLPEQIERQFRIELRGESSYRVPFEVPPRARNAPEPDSRSQTFETMLFWNAEADNRPLALLGAPKPQSA